MIFFLYLFFHLSYHSIISSYVYLHFIRLDGRYVKLNTVSFKQTFPSLVSFPQCLVTYNDVSPCHGSNSNNQFTKYQSAIWSTERTL